MNGGQMHLAVTGAAGRGRGNLLLPGQAAGNVAGVVTGVAGGLAGVPAAVASTNRPGLKNAA